MSWEWFCSKFIMQQHFFVMAPDNFFLRCGLEFMSTEKSRMYHPCALPSHEFEAT